MDPSTWTVIRDYSYEGGFFGFVRGVGPQQVIDAAGGSGREIFRTTGDEATQMDADLYGRGLTLLRAGAVGEWTLFMNALSANLSSRSFFSEISRDGDALGFYWDSMEWFTYARNGSVEIHCDPLFGMPESGSDSALARKLRRAVPDRSTLAEFFVVCEEHFGISIGPEEIAAPMISVCLDV